MWIGTDSCIYKYSSAAWTRYNTRTEPFPYAYVTFLSPDDSGRVYVGVYSGPGARGSAFGIFDGTTWTPIKRGTYPYTIFRDSKNTFWIVSDAGLSSYANGKETNYTCLAADLVNNAAFAEDRLGNVWLASSTAGLLRFDGTKWDTISTIVPISTDYYPSTLHCDSSGAIWLGYSRGYSGSASVSGFLTCYRNGTWSTFDYQNSSFPNTPIVCCSQDLEGNLYLGSSNQGILMLGPERNIVSSRAVQRSILTPRSVNTSKLLMLNGSNPGKYRTLSNATLFDLKGREITYRNRKNAICVIKPASK
jgi:ligand-binding sensor domain-containing protein